MKKNKFNLILSLSLILVFCFICSSCGDKQNISSSNTSFEKRVDQKLKNDKELASVYKNKTKVDSNKNYTNNITGQWYWEVKDYNGRVIGSGRFLFVENSKGRIRGNSINPLAVRAIEGRGGDPNVSFAIRTNKLNGSRAGENQVEFYVQSFDGTIIKNKAILSSNGTVMNGSSQEDYILEGERKSKSDNWTAKRITG